MSIQKFIFIHMAGSERVNKAGLDSGPTWKNGMLSLAAVVNHFGLSTFQGCCELLSKRKPIQGGKKIAADIPWKDIEHTKALKPIFDGTSLCGFIFCVSQAKENSGETWCTCKFGKICQKVRSNVIKPTDITISKNLKD